MRKTRRRKVHAKHAPRRRPMHARKQQFKGLDNTRDLDFILGNEKLASTLMGFSQENTSMLYEQAMGYLQANRIEEEISAFLLLTKFNPYLADFWNGLGVAYHLHEEFPDAFNAFLMALTMDPSRYETYAYSIECCLEMKNFTQAEALLKQAISFARRHPRYEESAIILAEAPRMAALIEAKISLSK